MSDRSTLDSPSEGSDSIDIEGEVATLAGSLNVLNAQLVEIVERALATDEWVGPSFL